MNLDVLKNNIGTINERQDCLYPVYLLYPDLNEYEVIQDEDYFNPIILQNFSPISIEELKDGDLIVLKFFNGYHFAIYKEKNQIYHCCAKFKLRISSLEKYQKNIIGCYRR
jgi:hypothetical protein